VTETEGTTSQVLRDSSAGGKAIRGGIVRVLGYGLSMALTAVASLVLLRYLGVDDFGRYATVTALVAIVQGLTDAGLNVVGQREYVLRRTAADQDDLVADVVAIRLAITPLGVGIAALFAVVAGYDAQMVAGTLIAGSGLVVANVAVSLTLPLAANLRLGWVTFIDVMRNAAIAVVVAVLAAVGTSLAPLFAAQLAGGIAALAATLVALGRAGRIAPRFALARWRPLLVAAAPMAASLVLNVIYLRTLLVMMSLLADPQETGLFATSARILEVFLGVPILMIGAAFPILVQAGADDAARLAYATGRLVHASLLVGILLALILAIGAEPIVVLLGGDAYRDAAPVLRIQALVLVPAFLTQVGAFGLVSLHRQRALVVINVVALVTVLALGAVLIPAAGEIGAAVAAVAGETALAVTAIGLLSRARRELRPDPRPLSRLVPAVAAALAVTLIPGVPASVEAALAAFVFAGVAWLLGAVPAELLDALRPAARRTPPPAAPPPPGPPAG
jgi:O-antigen/teichoic acid export membrane protein